MREVDLLRRGFPIEPQASIMAVMPSRPRIFHNPSVNPNYDDTVLTILSLRQVHRPDLKHASSVGL